MVPLNPSVPVSHDSMTVSQHERYQDPEIGAAKWNSAIVNCVIYTFAFPTVTCQNVFCEEQSLWELKLTYWHIVIWKNIILACKFGDLS